MSLQLLMNLIDEACKSGSITIDIKNYLLKKAVEFGISTDMVEKMLSAKKINIIASEQTPNSTESVLASINASLRKTFSDYLSKGSYDTIIDYFEDKLLGTLDYVLTDAYLKALICKEEYQKAYTQSEKLKENIKSDVKKIYPTLGQIYLNAKKYNKAFDIYYSLLADNYSESEDNLDLLVNNVLNDGEFDLLGKCRKNKNYLNLAKGKLPVFFEGKKYLFYIKLFEADFQDDDSFVKNYIWSLYRNDGTEKNAYEKGKYYISKIANPESLSYVMGLTCSYLEKWFEAYEFFKNCLSRDIDVQEDIDKIIDKIIEKKDWSILTEFKGSLNYDVKVEKTFTLLNDSDDYENIIAFFESLNLGIADRYKIKRYVYSLYRISGSKSLIKYNEFNSYFSDDKYWFWIGGKIFEASKEHETALDLYRKAEAIELGYCTDDVKRVNYILNPEIHFTDLYNEEKYAEAIEIFESKLKKTSDIKLIVPYISSLYKNEGTEEKGLELGILYSKSNTEGNKLLRTIAFICKYLKKYTLAKEYFNKAKEAGYDVEEELQEINMIIAKAEEEERRRKEEEERKRKEEIERKRIAAERKKEEELERIRIQEIEDEREAAQRRKEERERKEREAEEQEESEKEEKVTQEQSDSKIGEHHFTNDWKRGGNVLLQEHIYVNYDEVTWEKKKTVLFGKDSTTIPIDKVSQVELETSLIGTDIIIRGKGFGQIRGTNFKKSDAKKIESLILKAQRK
jgi:hypothetical protein